jgi:dTDP-glucose 4,6-dehydratase
VIEILRNPASDGHCFNIGNPQGSITNLILAKMIKRLAESHSEIVFKQHPGPEVEIRVPSIEKAQTILGYTPKINLESGISKTIEWYRSHQGV